MYNFDSKILRNNRAYKNTQIFLPCLRLITKWKIACMLKTLQKLAWSRRDYKLKPLSGPTAVRLERKEQRLTGGACR